MAFQCLGKCINQQSRSIAVLPMETAAENQTTGFANIIIKTEESESSRVGDVSEILINKKRRVFALATPPLPPRRKLRVTGRRFNCRAFQAGPISAQATRPGRPQARRRPPPRRAAGPSLSGLGAQRPALRPPAPHLRLRALRGHHTALPRRPGPEKMLHW